MATILHVITNFEQLGGAEASLKRFIDACPHHQHTVVSLMSIADVNKAMLFDRGIPCFALGIGSAVSMAIGAITFSHQITRLRPTAIVCWMYHANFFGTIAAALGRTKTPVFWNIRHSLDDMSEESYSTKLAISVNRLMSRWAHGIIYCSRRGQIQHETLGFCSRNSIYIPNGYEFSPQTVSKPMRERDKSRLKVGAAGRLHSSKDYPTLLAAVAKVLVANPHIEFVLAGYGVSMHNPQFVQMLNNAGLDSQRVKSVGQVSDMNSFYASLDFFVLSSRTEAFPNVLAEAMGHGIPCITTDVGDAAEIVADCGVVVQTRDPEELAEAILKLASLTDEEREDLGRRAGESVCSRYGITRMVTAYLDFFGLESISGAAIGYESQTG